jgi:hypothetical protein
MTCRVFTCYLRQFRWLSHFTAGEHACPRIALAPQFMFISAIKTSGSLMAWNLSASDILACFASGLPALIFFFGGGDADFVSSVTVSSSSSSFNFDANNCSVTVRAKHTQKLSSNTLFAFNN